MCAALVRFYRWLRYRKGFGVHSPFVFNLITKVIEERCPYYCFYDIALSRKKQVLHNAIQPRQGELLFRLTNYFQPSNILQIGPSQSLSALYLTSYRTGLECVSLEKEYARLLPDILQEMETLDFVFFNRTIEQNLYIGLFYECSNHINNGTVFVCDGINASCEMKKTWKKICSDERVTVSVDLYSMGIVFFNRKLHKQDYKVYF